ncbi:DUF5131 family protein [Parasphingorhabdus sp.]|uniref:DUF5131 family protein n=1 Tax=Parasphingorhabdus sp. TaxID=2709688 RepID=UPI003A94C03A
MTDSNIEWTEQTWNPLAGCTIKSPGCKHCYAMKMAKRCEAMGIAKYAGTTMTVKGKAVWTGKINFDEKALLAPLARKKPTMYFVNSMSDMFHEDVPNYWIDKVFAVMALCPQHTFQVLTKRADRMREYCTNIPGHDDRWFAAIQSGRSGKGAFALQDAHERLHRAGVLRNVWMGVSVEDQKRADERIPDLLATPAAVRWLSMDPLLGPVEIDPTKNEATLRVENRISVSTGARVRSKIENLDWIVVGGESGPGAREFDPDWARSIRDQCAAANVPFFMKQMGGANKARMPEIPGDLMVREYPK